MTTESTRRIFSLFALVTLAGGCGDGPTQPGGSGPAVRIVAGGAVADTIESELLQALIVEVRDAGGRVLPGAIVRFQSRPPTDPARQYEPAVYVCELTAPTCNYSQFVADTTDRSGRAKVVVRLGQVAGTAVVLASVPELGVQDSATFTVKPGAATAISLSPSDTTLDIGGTLTLQAHLTDRYGNARTEVPALSVGTGNAITVDAASGTVTGHDMGTQWVYAHSGAIADSAVVRVIPSGRLVVWSSALAVVRLVNINGKDERTIINTVGSDYGVFPRFDPTRQRVTMHSANLSNAGPSSDAIVIDTTASGRRDITGFSEIVAVRQTNDGNVMVVGRRSADPSGYFLFRVTADNTITLIATLNGLGGTYGGADIAYDGNQVAYISGTALNVYNVSTGATTTLDQNARSPRWSVQGDRLAYLFPGPCDNGLDGIATVINADGTGRKVLANFCYSPGLAWSPDAKYIIGRSSQNYFELGLRILRVSDGADALVRFSSSNQPMDYYQPDWR